MRVACLLKLATESLFDEILGDIGEHDCVPLSLAAQTHLAGLEYGRRSVGNDSNALEDLALLFEYDSRGAVGFLGLYIHAHLITQDHIVAAENGTGINGHRTQRDGRSVCEKVDVGDEETKDRQQLEENADEECCAAIHWCDRERRFLRWRSRMELRTRMTMPPRMKAIERSSISNAHEKYWIRMAIPSPRIPRLMTPAMRSTVPYQMTVSRKTNVSRTWTTYRPEMRSGTLEESLP